MVRAVCVDPQRTAEIYPSIAALIEAAYAAADEFVPENIIEWMSSGHVLLWLAVDDSETPLAAVTTELWKRPSGLVCKIVACGGVGLKRWLPLLRAIEDYAAAEGCSKILIEGRPGWVRLLTDYAPVRVAIERRI